MLDYDESLLILELSYVKPPYILDFAQATLDHPPPGSDPDSPEWELRGAEIHKKRWPEVRRLLDALRHLGIFYTDIHRENIRIEP